MKQENHFSIVGPIPHSHSSAPKAGGTRRASAPAAAIGLAMLAISILGSTGVASGQEPKTWSEEEGVEEPKGEATIRGSVASTYSLGESMPFSVVAVNESSTRSPVTVEHPGTSTIALTLERIDGHVDERPIYEAVYDGNAAATVGPDGRLDFLRVPDEMTNLEAGESVALELEMSEIFGFDLIDPGLYRLSLATAEGLAPYEVVEFSIVFDSVTSAAYLNKLLEKGGYIEKTWAQRMLAEHP